MKFGISVEKHSYQKNGSLPAAAALGFLLLMLCLYSTVLSGIASANPTGDDDKNKNSLALVKVYDLCFGAIITTPTPGTIKINTDGTVTSLGGVFAMHLTGFTPQAALFKLTIHNASDGEDDDHECDQSERDDTRNDDDRTTFTRDGCVVNISLPTSIDLTSPGGSKMTADQFTLKRTNGNINVGATLHVNANQPNATYNGTFLVTAALE